MVGWALKINYLSIYLHSLPYTASLLFKYILTMQRKGRVKCHHSKQGYRVGTIIIE